MLELKGVVKCYGDTTAVDKVSMKVETGTIAALIGPNGAGKSTTFRLISGLLHADDGQILWCRQRLESALTREQRGFLPEERGLYQAIEVEQLLRYWARLRNIDSSAIPAVLEDWISRFELDSKRRALVRTLSKGNQQKVQLAICLMHSPKLIVLDEPFSGLDPLNQDLVSEILLEQAASGATILISAHQMALVERMATTVTLMHAGRTVAMPAFGKSGERQADSLQRLVVVHIESGARLLPTDLPPHQVTHTADDKITIKFPAMRLAAFTDALAELAALDGVADLEFSRPSLHRAYVESVSTNTTGAGNGSSCT